METKQILETILMISEEKLDIPIWNFKMGRNEKTAPRLHRTGCSYALWNP